MATTRLWALIQQWLDVQLFHVSQAQLANKLGVQRSAISQWKLGQSTPRPEHLRALAKLTGVPFVDLRTAVAEDLGYLEQDEEVMGNAQHPAPIGEVRGSVDPGVSTDRLDEVVPTDTPSTDAENSSQRG